MELKPEQITAMIDTREQLPLDLSPLKSVTGTLVTGDYSILHFEDECVVERKSLPDLIACIGRERSRFERELERMRGCAAKVVVVEAEWRDLEAGSWQGKVTPQSAVGSVLGWIGWGIPFIFAGDHDRASRFTARFLFIEARRRYRKLRQFINENQT